MIIKFNPLQLRWGGLFVIVRLSFSIYNENELLSTLPRRGGLFLILRFIVSILNDNQL